MRLFRSKSAATARCVSAFERGDEALVVIAQARLDDKVAAVSVGAHRDARVVATDAARTAHDDSSAGKPC